MSKDNKSTQSSLKTSEMILTKDDIGTLFIANASGKKEGNRYTLTVKYNGQDSKSEANQSTFEGYVKEDFVKEDFIDKKNPKKNICVKLISVDKNNYEFVPKDTVISYHTFMFPFLFEMNKKTTRSKFEACCHPGWFPDVWEPDQMNDQLWYNQYHYFNEAAHNAIYMPKDFKDKPEAVVRNLRFDLLSLAEETPTANPKRESERSKNSTNPIKYVICKGEKKYHLDVNAIRMKLYNTGVGILIFELENRSYPSEQEVTEINDFGRRIYAPYYSYNSKYDSMFCSICADSIYFEVNGKGVEQEQASLIPKELRSAADVTVLAEPIKTLLSNNKYRVTTKKECAMDEICIEPIIDDRMFVACYYTNGDFVDAMREWDGDQYRYLTHAKEMNPFDNEDNKNAANRLYTMMYVDGDGVSCHGRDMMQKMLSDDHIYTRWLEYGCFEKEEGQKKEKTFAGTITGFSEYTMISVAKKPVDDLIDAFLTQYVEMATLALAQRASLLSFEYMISECAHERNYKIETIQKKYMLFQSQILLKEVSPQQQGIEIYDMLEENLMIEKQQNEIKEQIEGLFEQRNFEHKKIENSFLFWIAMLGNIDIINTVVDLFYNNCNGSVEALYVSIFKILLSLVIIASIYIKQKRNN